SQEGLTEHTPQRSVAKSHRGHQARQFPFICYPVSFLPYSFLAGSDTTAAAVCTGSNCKRCFGTRCVLLLQYTRHCTTLNAQRSLSDCVCSRSHGNRKQGSAQDLPAGSPALVFESFSEGPEYELRLRVLLLCSAAAVWGWLVDRETTSSTLFPTTTTNHRLVLLLVGGKEPWTEQAAAA
ncbi:unnamed protein product, partial [Ectocarpus sp. 13 AM-2016]